MANRSRNILVAVVAIGSLVAPGARADVFRDVAVGLGLAGFNIEGRRNVLNDGIDFAISHNFVGNELDFGLADLTIQGPLSLSFSTGRRGLSTLELSLRSAINNNDQVSASPLTYTFNADVGGQSTQVTGQLFVDANLDFNGLGFYTIDLAYSSRQDVARRGTIDNSRDEYDFDIGPVNVTGNVVAYLLTLVTDPFFAAAGAENPFAAFSGRSQIQTLLASSLEDTLTDFAHGANQTNDKAFIATSDAYDDNPADAGKRDGRFNSVVPEPSVSLLMIAGLAVIVQGSIRRRRHAV